jgi:hypothetical protein
MICARPQLERGTQRLGGRFTSCRQLLLCWSRLVWSSSGYRSMSAVCASFWHATDTVCSLSPAPVCSPAPGLASPSVHKYEAQHDYKNDAEDQHKTADAEAIARLRDKRDTGQHYLAPTE